MCQKKAFFKIYFPMVFCLGAMSMYGLSVDRSNIKIFYPIIHSRYYRLPKSPQMNVVKREKNRFSLGTCQKVVSRNFSGEWNAFVGF